MVCEKADEPRQSEPLLMPSVEAESSEVCELAALVSLFQLAGWVDSPWLVQCGEAAFFLPGGIHLIGVRHSSVAELFLFP